MLRKFASLAVLDAWRVPNSGTVRSIRKAAHRVDFEYTPRPGYLYVRARAISSRTNDNFDTFPAEEIEKGYRTFLGKPCFINHHNANHRRARGVIVAAALHHDRNPDGSPDTWVELLHEIDAVRFPKLAKGILSGRINRTSMGVDCEHSICSACGNKATNPAEYCQHMPGKKGMKFRKRGSDGKIREQIIHEICAGLTFFENSFLVEDPADPTAHVLDKPHLHPVTASRPAAPDLMAHFAAGRRYFDQPLYHGTRTPLEPGEHLTVDQARRHPNNPDLQTEPYVHATTDPAEAHRWGERADSSAASRRAEELGRERRMPPGGNSDQQYPSRVYRVRPTGHTEPDPAYADTEHDSYRSPHPMRVAEEVRPLECYAEECHGAEHWPGHPHYQYLKNEQDEQDEDDRQRREASMMQTEAAPRYADPSTHPWFQAHPVHKDNVKAAWYDSTQDEKDQGRRWYPDAHIVATAIAHGDAAKGAGLLAAYSPRTNWPANMFNAARSVHEGRAMGSRKGDGAIMGMHWRPAARILAGEHHSQVLKGPKVRAFAHLIEHGGNTDDDIASGSAQVVVDRHALSVAAGHRLTDKEAINAPIDKPHYYQHAAQTYHDASREVSAETGQKVTPEWMQATTWLRQVRRNTEEDAAVGNAFGGGGRTTRNRNDLNRWTEYARQHHPDIRGETMHTGMQHASAFSMMAADPPLRVPPSVDTLRPEACPVCGDQDVFKGQRCPICGFVAPPDIFRDPDIDAARANREQLEEGKQTSALPEGPADEEQIGSGQDAEDQMFHPDQIAPDGVPGVQPDATAPGQGLLSPDGEPLDPDALAEGEEPELDENGEPVEDEGDEEGAAVEEDAEAQEDEAMAEQMGAKAEGEEEAAEEEDEEAEGGSPGKDQDEDDERPGGKRMAKQQRTAELAAITAQQRVVDELRRENAVLNAQLSFIASLAGVSEELAAIRKQADEANPAQPVPDPPQAAPTSTTEQALMTGAPTGSGTGTHRGPGHTEDDPSRPGTTPGSLTAVPAEQVTTAVTPGVEMQTPPANQLIDVTAPVQGTNPSQDGGVPIEQRRIETDVRIDPDPLKAQGPGIGGQGNDGTAFPWTLAGQQATASLNAEDERGARTFAAIRLAKLRITAGLTRGDELDVATHIERDAGLTLHDIEREIGTLSQVTKAAAVAQAQPRYPRQLAPKSAARVAPSFAETPQPAMAMTAGVNGYDSDDFDLFVD